MRTTIDIDDTLLALAKKRALEKGVSLKRIIEAALRQVLLCPKHSSSKFHLRWKTVRGKIIPGVDITDRDSLYDCMDERG